MQVENWKNLKEGRFVRGVNTTFGPEGEIAFCVIDIGINYLESIEEASNDYLTKYLLRGKQNWPLTAEDPRMISPAIPSRMEFLRWPDRFAEIGFIAASWLYCWLY
jgi:hypothetical protein